MSHDTSTIRNLNFGGKDIYKEDRLPQNAKESILFVLIISIISVTLLPLLLWGWSEDSVKKTI